MRIAHSELLKILDYDPLTGIFSRKSGEIAGSMHHKGYVRVCIGKREYLAHRLAWFYVTGEWPKSQLDHRNTVKSDNRFSNLRLATGFENGRNRPRMKNNTSGHKGVSWHKRFKKWQACIVTDGKFKYLGRFETKEEAAEAYAVAALKYHGEFARLDL